MMYSCPFSVKKIESRHPKDDKETIDTSAIIQLSQKISILQNNTYVVRQSIKKFLSNQKLPNQENQLISGLISQYQQSAISNILKDSDLSIKVKDNSTEIEINEQSPQINHLQIQVQQTVQGIKKQRKRNLSLEITNVNSNYTKNITVNVFDKAFKELLNKKYLRKMERSCKKRNINFQILRKYLLQLTKNKGGPNIIRPFFEPTSSQQIPIYKMLDYLICKYFRGRYMLYALQNGKMKDLSAYIEMKNKYFLYYSQLFEQQSH